MKAIIEGNEILEIVKTYMTLSYKVESIEWSEEKEITIGISAKPITKPPPTQPSRPERKPIEGRDVMSNNPKKRTDNMVVF